MAKQKKVQDGFVIAKSDRKFLAKPVALERSFRKIEFYTDDELMRVPAGSVFVFDAEVYRNFFYVAFKNVVSGKYVSFELSPDLQLNTTKLQWMMWRFKIVGFNSLSYDIPIIQFACTGKSCEQIKEASDWLIAEGRDERGIPKKVPQFVIEKKLGIRLPNFNHIDLIEVAPLKGSLKLYAGRLNCRRMQDLPYEHTHILTQADAAIVRPYCCNDLDNTELLAKELWPAIVLREQMSAEYGVDLRSKSDAQIAEAVFCAEIKKITGWSPRKVENAPEFVTYQAPPEIKFQSPELNDLLLRFESATYYLDGGGNPIAPNNLKDYKVFIAGKPYTVGMGGIHSNEKEQACYADDNWMIADNDVESFYPRIILNQRLFPAHLGTVWLQVFDILVNRRLEAKAKAKACKKAGDREGEKAWKQIADSLKITINGSFGKLGDRWSAIFAPQLMLQVTISGQLYLLMLVERLALGGFDVIQANTDGVVAHYLRSQNEKVREIVAQWEKDTNFKTEETRYKAIFSKDVNSYIALKEEGGDPEARFLDQRLGFKTKGDYCERGSAGDSVLSRNPEAFVCVDAVMQFILNRKPVAQTIKETRDMTRFMSIYNVRGGGEKNGYYLGKTVRWYYPKNEPGCISYVGSGNKVPKTDGARPAMDLPDAFPEDINYDWYANAAIDMLYKLGVIKKAKTAELF